MPLSIFRIKGLAAADTTWLLAMAGFFAMFFFLTLYMQEVLGFSPIQAGAAYLPVTACLALASGVCSQLFARIGTRPVIVTGALLSACGIYYLSRIPLHGSYVPDVLPGLVMMALGFGAVFVGVTTAANAGVPADKAGLAAGLLSTSQQLGMALGLAVLSPIATARTDHLLAAHAGAPRRAHLRLPAHCWSAASSSSPRRRSRPASQTRAHPRSRSSVALNPPPSPRPSRSPRTTERRQPVKFMLQVRFNGAQATINSLPAHEQQAIVAEFEAVRETAGVVDGNRLQPAGTATTVRVRNGQIEITDGLLVDSSAALDGYYLYDALDLEAATALAARVPATRFGATVEIRPVVER